MSQHLHLHYQDQAFPNYSLEATRLHDLHLPLHWPYNEFTAVKMMQRISMQRLTSELKKLQKENSEDSVKHQFQVSAEDTNNIYHWKVSFNTFKNGVYKGKRLSITISFPGSYPKAPPTKIQFSPVIPYNVNVDQSDGTIRLPLFNNWEMGNDVNDVIKEVIHTLENPNDQGCLPTRNEPVLALFKSNKKEYEAKALGSVQDT